jgi:hypothetical protein
MPPTITMSSDAYTQMSNELNQMGRQYREQMIINKQLIKENEELKEEINKLKEEIEPKELYADEDEWVEGSAGTTQNETEYVIHISGGGDCNSPNGFEDWVIKKDADGELRYYIRHGLPSSDKLQEGMRLVSCPDGLYISFQGEDYELREGEQDDWSWLDDELETFETPTYKHQTHEGGHFQTDSDE